MNITIHRRVLLSLLQKIYTHSSLGPTLGFKGGTCLYFLYQLPRFSVDLDFTVIEKNAAFSAQDMQRILATELALNDVKEKRNTWLWNGVYEPGQWNIAVEVAKWQYEEEYEQLHLYGLPVQSMKLEYQLTHKLCAITDRNSLVSRDIFDVHFLLKKHITIVDTIIRERTGAETKEYLRSLLTFIPKHVSKRGILDGLGELLDPDIKKWVSASLLKETLFLIESRMGEY